MLHLRKASGSGLRASKDTARIPLAAGDGRCAAGNGARHSYNRTGGRAPRDRADQGGRTLPPAIATAAPSANPSTAGATPAAPRRDETSPRTRAPARQGRQRRPGGGDTGARIGGRNGRGGGERAPTDRPGRRRQHHADRSRKGGSPALRGDTLQRVEATLPQQRGGVVDTDVATPPPEPGRGGVGREEGAHLPQQGMHPMRPRQKLAWSHPPASGVQTRRARRGRLPPMLPPVQGGLGR